MVKRKTDSDTAVIDPPATPEQIAARVAAADVEHRHAAAVADIVQWREIVTSIADGHEPSGKELAAIGDLARRLRLPPDAVGSSVRAIQTERRHQAEVARVRDRVTEIKDHEPQLRADIKAVEQRLLELRGQLGEYVGIHDSLHHTVRAAAEVRQENPLLFAAPEHVASRLVASDSGMALKTLTDMIPQPERLEGHFTKSGWRG